MAAFDPFDSEPQFVSATQIQEQSRHPPTHHKKNSTFANVPFAVTNGMDDFIGFSPTETRLNQEINELKEIVRENQDIIDAKEMVIRQLRDENRELKQLVEQLTSKQPSPSPPPPDGNGDHLVVRGTDTEISSPSEWQQPHNTRQRGARSASFSRKSPSSILTKGSDLFSKQSKGVNSKTVPIGSGYSHSDSIHLSPTKHALSPSISHFLGDLDVKFKDDDRGRDHLHRDHGHGRNAGGHHMMTPSNTPFPSVAYPEDDGVNGLEVDDDDEDEDDDDDQENDGHYISTTEMMETTGGDPVDGQISFLHLRRSSLSEEERQAMELQASKDRDDTLCAAADGDGHHTITGMDDNGHNDYNSNYNEHEEDGGLARSHRGNVNAVTVMNPMLMEEGNDTVETGGAPPSSSSMGLHNVVFNDSNVANMNMNIINHHQHMMYNEVAQNMEDTVDRVKAENRRLEAVIEEMKATKLELIMNTAMEMNRLRRIIRLHVK